MKKQIIHLVAVILIAIGLTSTVSLEEQLPPLIRLHVLANSDSAQDQALKLLVRDKVIKVMNEKFRDSQSLEESREILLQNLPLLENTAAETLQAAGSNYAVQAQHGQFDFPTKYYGSFALPAGRYEAVRLVIGQGQGANWWCVLFPPLCVVDGKVNNVPRAEAAKEIAESMSRGKVVKIKPAFKVVEIWKSLSL